MCDRAVSDRIDRAEGKTAAEKLTFRSKARGDGSQAKTSGDKRDLVHGRAAE